MSFGKGFKDNPSGGFGSASKAAKPLTEARPTVQSVPDATEAAPATAAPVTDFGTAPKPAAPGVVVAETNVQTSATPAPAADEAKP